MKFKQWMRRAARVMINSGRSVARSSAALAGTLLSPIGFREVLLLGGSALLSIGASAVYPPAAFIAPGLILVGVAVFGVRA